MRDDGIPNLVVGALVATGALVGAGPALAATSTCGGTFDSPGLLAGHYAGNVTVTGVCFVNGAPAVVSGNLTVAPNAVLNATFANDDVDGAGSTGLTVHGNVRVRQRRAARPGVRTRGVAVLG